LKISKKNDTESVYKTYQKLPRKNPNVIIHTDHGKAHFAKKVVNFVNSFGGKLSAGRIGKSIDNY
jgi:hypothetical protein